jgi:hypothetical protein
MLACFFLKLSLGLGHLRILKFQHLDSRWERVVCYAIIGFSCIINLHAFFSLLFTCAAYGVAPLQSASAIVAGKCFLTTHYVFITTYLQSTANVVVDWTLVILPIPSVLGTIMDRRTRLSVIGILILGAR